MTQYALFIFESHEAAVGIDDLSMIGTMDECIATAEQSDNMTVCQIVSLPSLKVVKRGEWGYTPSPLVGGSITWHYEWTDCA